MRNPKETRLEGIMKLLQQLKLTSEQLDDLESYLAGEKGEEVLDDLPYQNLFLPKITDSSVVIGLFKHGRLEEAGKLFNILFAVGGTSCISFFPYIIREGTGLTYLWKLPVDPAKVLTVYATADFHNFLYCTATGRSIKQMNLNLDTIKKSYLLADYPKNIKNISNQEMHYCDNTKLILLASYFLLKYPNAEEFWKKEEKQGSLLSNMGKFFGETPEVNRWVAKEDLPMMQQYENILIDNLGNLYAAHTMPVSVLQEIKQAVRQNQVTDRILNLADRKSKIPSSILELLGETALLNFSLSDILRNVAKICFKVDPQHMFTRAVLATNQLWMDIRVKGGDYDDYFAIDSKTLIFQAASRELNAVLNTQFHKNKTVFMQVLENANPHDSSVMMQVLQQEDKRLFLEQRKNGTKERDKLIDLILSGKPVIEDVKKYLRGETDVSFLYPLEDQIYVKFGYGYYNISQLKNLMQSYAETYHDRRFYDRVLIHQFLIGSSYYFYWILTYTHPDTRETCIDMQKVRELFTSFDTEHLDMVHQLKFYSMMYQYFYAEKHKESLKKASVEVFSKYLTVKREEVLSAFKESEAVGRAFAVEVLGINAEEYKTEILAFSQDSSKLVKEALYEVLCEQKNWEEEILAFLSSKKAPERELAVRILAKWNAEKYQAELAAALEKEKNSKIRTLLQDLLSTDAGQAGGILSLQDLVKDLHKGGKKRSLAWAYETPFSDVHKKNGEPTEEAYLQAILLCYASMTNCGVSKDAADLAAELNEAEFALYVNELFDKWLNLGAEAKKRWVLYASSIHGGTDIIKKLQHQINDWPQHSRGAIAADAVQALALNPKPEALLIVDSISRKFKFRQVKVAAGEALKFAAAQLNITTEELADRIVPNLGFDENMERSFDYGERKFTVTITPSLEVEVFDEEGKKLKNMPAPGKKDDPKKAAESYAAFKDMKKQMKTTVSSQKMRLELALSTERQWNCDAWKNLFVKNPIMHQFAIGLIWGIYEGKKLTQTFRYMEDGSFNTEDEDEFTLPENVKIGLVHPVELSEESIFTWKTQLEDYEITQPIEQLSRPVYHMTAEEAESKSMERFGGCILNDLSLSGKMQNMGWYRGLAEDAGIFYYYYKEDKEQDLRTELNFSGSYVAGENEDVTVYDVKFNKNIKDIPERYFSEIVMQTSRAVSASQEKNELWKDNK